MSELRLPSIHRKDGGAEARPPAKPTDTLDIRECTAYIVQLRVLLDEANAEPPQDVDRTEVEHRIALLQELLDEVMMRREALVLRQEMEEKERLEQNRTRRMQLQEEADKQRARAEQQRKTQLEEMRRQQAMYYKDRNDRELAKAKQCQTYNVQSQVNKVLRASSSEEHRAQNLQQLMQRRDEQHRERRARRLALEQAAQTVNAQHAAQLERRRRELEAQAREHEELIQTKVAAAHEARRGRWHAKQAASRARSVVVLRNGEAILETELRDHDKLVQEMQQKEQQQRARYAEENAERVAYLQERARYRAVCAERQQHNLISLLDARVKRGEAICEEAKAKKERAGQIRSRLAAHFTATGTLLRRKLNEHRHRAEALEQTRYNETLSKKYSRWNRHAARLVAELKESLAAEEGRDNTATTSATGASSRRASHFQTGGAAAGQGGEEAMMEQKMRGARGGMAAAAATAPSARSLRLPSPADFAV